MKTAKMLNRKTGEVETLKVTRVTPCGLGGVVKTKGGYRAVHAGVAADGQGVLHMFPYALQREAFAFACKFAELTSQGVFGATASRLSREAVDVIR